MFPTRRFVIKVKEMFVSSLEVIYITLGDDAPYEVRMDRNNAFVIKTHTHNDYLEMKRLAEKLHGELIEV